MRGRTGRTVEVDSVDDLDGLVAAGAHRMRGWRVRDVDLRDRTSQLLTLDPAGSVLLGCELSEEAEAYLRKGGALLFPNVPDLPFDPYRAQLYSPVELYAGIEEHAYVDTPDAAIYAWSLERADSVVRIAAALHDHAIDTALEAELADSRTVGIMGNHATPRGSGDYDAAARLGATLAHAGIRVVTGGGPGSMEAANLGAYLSTYADDVRDEAVRLLAAVPVFRPSVTDWARSAFAVRTRWPHGSPSVGIPTWFYGHEPPNLFASAIAKYFQNSLREDTLLRHCDAGIVFMPGAAGTVQEIFQDACDTYYADTATVIPMILVNRTYWTERVPTWPLLTALAAGRPMVDAIHLVDSLDEALAIIAP